MMDTTEQEIIEEQHHCVTHHDEHDHKKRKHKAFFVLSALGVRSGCAMGALRVREGCALGALGVRSGCARGAPNPWFADNAEGEPRRPVVPRTPGESHSDDSGLEEATTTARQFIQDCERYNQMRRLGSSMK